MPGSADHLSDGPILNGIPTHLPDIDPDETNEWLEGYDAQREAWEKQYADAHARWEAHRAQIEKAAQEDAEAASAPAASTSYSSGGPSTEDTGADSGAGLNMGEGTLASDEALAALREKLTGN